MPSDQENMKNNNSSNQGFSYRTVTCETVFQDLAPPIKR